jgi:hypothetical protein
LAGESTRALARGAGMAPLHANPCFQAGDGFREADRHLTFHILPAIRISSCCLP